MSFNKFFALVVAAFLVNISFAQQTGKVDYKTLGVSFTIPQGYVGQEVNGVYLIGHNTIPGVMLVTTGDAQTIDQIKQEARLGIVDQQGTNLQLNSDFETINSKAIGAEFAGTAEYQAAKAYVVGLLNPYGQGMTIAYMTLENMYTPEHKAAAIKLAKSVQFRKPEYGPIVKEWKEKLNGVRLTYMSSYTSIDYSNPNFTSGGGYSSKTVIDLCPQGYFTFNGSSNFNVDTPGVTAGSNGSNKGAGNWKVIGNIEGQAVLQLNFNDGNINEYVLTMDGNKTMLNGSRYFRTWTGENAPYCP
ncbi:MAG: hypothetical protein AAF705_04625 [Bacteroidota bacterium]